MTIKEFLACIKGQLYVNNPELAELLAKHKKIVWADILLLNREYKDAERSFAIYCVNNSLTHDEAVTLLTCLTDKNLWKAVRMEYDEEYVEYGFLSVEDGGRGEEF